MRNGGWVESILAAGVLAALAEPGIGGGFRPDTHKPTSRESQDADKQRAEEKRQWRRDKRKGMR